MDLPPVESLQAMLLASELGSLSAAAAELGVTHGAVSRRIQSLESWLGLPVFERHGRGVRLTAAGEHFARRVERSMEAISSLAVDLRQRGQRNLVRLSVLPSTARLWVMPNIGALVGSPPDLMIGLRCEHRLAPLHTRDADLAIRSGSGGWSGVDAWPLFDEWLYPLAAPAMAASLTGASPRDLARQPLVHDGDVADWRRWFAEVGIAYRPGPSDLRFEDYDLTLAAAAAGLGVALARGALAHVFERSGALVRLSAPAVRVDRRPHLVVRTGENRPAVLRLAQRMRDAAQSQQPSMSTGGDHATG